jgi:hypothetical protein
VPRQAEQAIPPHLPVGFVAAVAVKHGRIEARRAKVLATLIGPTGFAAPQRFPMSVIPMDIGQRPRVTLPEIVE